MKTDDLYKQTLKHSDEYGERADCAVRAVAIATGEGYPMAHYALECQGRQMGEGTLLCDILTAVEELGYTWTKIESEDIPARTPTTLERLNMQGQYIVNFRGHVAAMVDGKVLDWTAGRRHRILRMYRIEKK